MCSIADSAVLFKIHERERDKLQVQADWRQDLNFGIYGVK